MLGHQLGRVVHRVRGHDGDELGRGAAARRPALKAFGAGDSRQLEVADEPPDAARPLVSGLAERNDAMHVVLRHRLRNLCEGRPQRDREHAPMHRLAHRESVERRDCAGMDSIQCLLE